MTPPSFARDRSPPDVIRHAVCLCLRSTLNHRDVAELRAERGQDVSSWSARRRVLTFGLPFARHLRDRQPRPSGQWHVDEMVVSTGGDRQWLWRAADSEGDVLDLRVQSKRYTGAALRLMRTLLRTRAIASTVVVTDTLWSGGAPRRDLDLSAWHEQGLRQNNRAENSHQPVRRQERKMRGFKSPGPAQRLLSMHACVHNTFTLERHRVVRRALRLLRAWAAEAWQSATAAA